MDLVRPGDLAAEAADADDLAQRFLSENLGKIVDENDERARQKLADQAQEKIRERYRERAKETYERLWDTCKKTHGHSPASVNVSGYTMMLCQVCGFAPKPENVPDDSAETKAERRRAKRYNDDRISQLAKQMLDLEIEAGLIELPTADEFIAPTNGRRRRSWRKKR